MRSERFVNIFSLAVGFAPRAARWKGDRVVKAWSRRRGRSAEVWTLPMRACALALARAGSQCRLLLPGRRNLHRHGTAPSRATHTMRFREYILPRWGALGRKARAAARVPAAEHRRAHRVAASMPVLVYGHSVQAPFAEPATTANVSKTGGLVPLSTNVIRSQRVMVTNLQTNEDALCRVARVVHADDGRTFAALEFLEPAPHFWSINFEGQTEGNFEGHAKGDFEGHVKGDSAGDFAPARTNRPRVY